MPKTRSQASLLASLPADERTKFLASLSDNEALLLLYDWDFWARPEQRLPPGDWLTWLVNAGRGWGKSRTGAEFTRHKASTLPGSRGALIAKTPGDAVTP